MASAPLLDREFLEKLERLTIHWQRSFAGLVGGHNKSRFPGSGQEFLDHRNFHQGDDLRAVNWRAYMRLEKLFLKMFQVDTIEIQGFANRLRQRVISTGGRHRFFGVMDGLSALQASGPTDYLASVKEFIGAYSQRGLVIIVSDFLDDQSCERALQYLTDYGHELMLLQIWADEDRVPPWTGELELRDAETGAGMKLDFDDDARRRYTRAFDEYSAGLQTMAMRSRGRYAGVATSQSLESVIFGDLIRVRGIACEAQGWQWA